MSTYFSRATAAGVSGQSTHAIATNINISPVHLTYVMTVGAGSGEVSAASYYTLDPIQNPAITPIWVPHTVALTTGTTAATVMFPIQGFMFSVFVSGSAHYAARLLQAGR